MNPAITLIMPTKNRATLITAAISSLQNQTRTDWQLIVVDDHSTDNTEAVIINLRDERITYIKLTEGTGPGAGRDFGIKHATTDLIGFCDSDDINLPERLAISLKAFDDPTVEVVYGDLQVKNTLTGESWSRPSNPFDLELLKRINYIPTPTVSLKKSAYQRSGGFDHSLKTSEDYDLWLKLAASEAKFFYTGASLVEMRIHEENTTKTVASEDRKNNLRLVRQRNSLPVPDQTETIQLIQNQKLKEIFSGDGAKNFWFAAQPLTGGKRPRNLRPCEQR